ncbi:alpha/beta hydrolase [Croceiramulus getboli]|nr:lysophospholipase [Flavobacteriaceae bacterium YJPT1-3]
MHLEQQLTFLKRQIHVEVFRPEQPKRAVILVHGFGDHLGRYVDSVIPVLQDAGCAVVAYDHLGHGKTQGKRGYAPSYEAVLDLLDQVVRYARQHFPDLPVMLYGHSMGGNIVLNYAMRRTQELCGVIATSPYLRLAFDPPAWKLKLGRLLLQLWPSFTLDSKLDPQAISRLPEEVARYQEDPLNHHEISPVYTFPVLDAGQWVLAHPDQLKVPTLLVHGTGDRITDHQASIDLHQKSSKTTLHLIPGGITNCIMTRIGMCFSSS